MKGGVDLSVATAGQAMPNLVPRPHRDRGCAVPAGKGCLGAEPAGPRRLAHDLGRTEHATARQRKQRGRQPLDEYSDLALEFVGTDGELATAQQELTGDTSHGSVDALKARLDLVHHVIATQRLRRDLKTGEELVEVPAQSALDPGPLFNQVIAVIDEKAQLPGLAVKSDHRKVGLAQRGPSDRQCIDGVRLPPVATTIAGASHEPRRYSDRGLAGNEEVPLKATGQMAAVLEGEEALGPAPSPRHRFEMTLGRGGHHLFGQLASSIVYRHQRVGALVRVNANDHHGVQPP
jgi:hypothetical protein